MASASRRRASTSTLSNSCPKNEPRRSCKTCSGRRACGATVAGWVRCKAEALAPVYRSIGECVAAAPVRCLDETGFRIAGDDPLAAHRLDANPHLLSRRRAPLGRARVRRAASWSTTIGAPTYSLETVDHAFCNAHLLRELQAVCELDKEPWAEALRATLLDANEAVRNGQGAGDASALAPETIKGFEDRYWAAVREGLALHRSLPAFDPSMNPKKRKKQRPAHNLLIRFKTFKEATRAPNSG